MFPAIPDQAEHRDQRCETKHPTASRSHHRNGALTASYQNLAYRRCRSPSLNVRFGSMLSKKSVFP